MKSESPVAISDGFFKGWAKPGPQVPAGVEPEEGETLDAMSGYYRIFQYRDGHRFSTDDILTAWYGTSFCPSAQRVLDLGSGIGSVGMVAAWRLQGAKFVTVEAQEASVALARKSIRYNGLESRYEIRMGDIRDETVLNASEKFDLILGSPPYFPLGSGVLSDHPQKIACRFEVRGSVADYCQTAARHLSMGGWFACVFHMNPPEQLSRIKEGAHSAGLTIVRYRPVTLREGEPPLLGLFAMVRSDHLPERFRDKTWIEPELVIRCKDGSIHPEYSAVKLSIGFPP